MSETVAMVIKRNNAYMVWFTGPLTDDATPDEQIDVAGSLTLAKRLAREGALEFGYVGPFHWSQDVPWRWNLDGEVPE
jgi:hypothetical protein